MPFPSVACSALALVAGLSAPLQSMVERDVAPSGKWKPLFDYTNLPPPNAELWEPLSKVQVTMEGAIEVAKQTETGTVRPLKAELKPNPEGAFWHLELFVGDEGTKRINLTVSTAEPKVLKRLELRSITPEEQELWAAYAQIKVPGEDSIEVAKKALYGQKVEALVLDTRARTLELSLFKGVTTWTLEMMGLDRKQHLSRRYLVAVNTKVPVRKYSMLMDRFVGTPLRRGLPTELENGLVIYDFKVGEGAELRPDSKVEVNYRLWLLDTTKVHDTWKSKLPETFLVSQAPLEGMRQGMLGMKAGGRRKICMPYTMGFGEAGNAIAPPRAMVVCDIHINSVDGVAAASGSDEPPEDPSEVGDEGAGGEESEDG